MVLVYDGRFESFLTLVYEVYYKKLRVSNILKKPPQSLFLEDIIIIEYEENKSNKVLQALQKNFSKDKFKTILNLFMCDSVEFELDLLQYIILGFKKSSNLEDINQQVVFRIKNLQKELFRFNHKMTGFVRFEELEDGTLYAKIETKFNIVYFLGQHFSKRLNNQEFIIHDLNRKLAFVHNKYAKGVQNISSFEIPKYSQSEEKFQKLWKTFFDSVSIESRKNLKLQQQWVPLIYRVYMREFT